MTGTILQFGTGRFLRGFIDPIAPRESVTVIQSRESGNGAEQINLARGHGYHLWIRGKLDGQIIDEFHTVGSLNRAWMANRDWQSVMNDVLDPSIQLIVSNTTEQGLQLDPRDTADVESTPNPPHSYPARLMSILWHRYREDLPGVTVLPLELVEGNGQVLKRLVIDQARQSIPQAEQAVFVKWLETQNRWLSNLVDRIVVGVSSTTPWEPEDPLAVMAEPFAMLAIQDDGGDRSILPDHPMISWVSDLEPLFVQKVRILNGLHTAMVARCLPQGFETVLQVVNDPHQRQWLESLLHDEILPTLKMQGIDSEQFAVQVMERFENPFFEHRLSDIANGHETKLRTRISPTHDEFRRGFGRTPEKLDWILRRQTERIG